MNIIEKIANLISPPPVNPNIKIADEAFKLSPGLAPSRDELDKIRKIAADYENAVEILNSHSALAIDQKIKDLHLEYRDATRSGKLKDIKLDGIDTMLNEFKLKRSLAQEQMSQLNAEGAAHAKPIYVRTISAVEAFAEKREGYEREQCVSFGLEFSPSPILRGARDLITILKNRIRLDALNGQPKGLYFFLYIP